MEKAVELLEGAVARLPGNVAARTLLGAVYLESGHYEKAFQIHEELDALIPQTPEDYLYKGYVQSIFNPTEALRTLDQAIGRQPSLIAHVLRAGVRADQAANTSDVTFAEEGIQDAEAAKTILRGNMMALGASVWVNQVAAGLYTPEEAAKREAALAKVRRDVEELARFPGLPKAILLRGWILEIHGHDDEMLKLWEESVRQPDVNFEIAYRYAMALYRQGEVKKALEFANTRFKPIGWHRYLRACLLAEFPDRHDEAVAAFREHVSKLPAWQGAWEFSSFLLFLGRKAESIATMREARPSLRRAPPVYAPFGDFLTDPSPESALQLLRAVGRSKRDQVDAHWNIGVAQLAEGNRKGAREQFEAAVATHCFYLSSYDLSRVYLARMMQDPTWPSWIPIKK
jgi:tetratricopeptide (TPR) repeat protein